MKLNFLAKLENSLKVIVPNLLINLKLTKILFSESYFKKKLKFYFSLKSFLYFYSLPKLNLENFLINKKKVFKNRLRILKNLKEVDKKDLLFQNILFYMPMNYIENYKILFLEVEKISLSDAIYTDGNEVNFDFIKFCIGKFKLNRKKVLIGQHSLRTGIQDYDTYFDYSKSIADYFLTWGWSDKLRFIYKFSSLRIFSSLKKYSKKSINNHNSNIGYILCGFSNIGECLYDNYSENKKSEKARINLLIKIQRQKKNKIFLKPRSGSFLLNDKKKFYEKFNVLKSQTRLYDVFGKFNVIIFERLSLGIVESIYLDQPTIFYYPKSLYKHQSKKYKKLMQTLKSANIHFDSSQKILNILSSNENISKWWNDKENIKNRKNFLIKYAKSFKYYDLNKLRKTIC